MKRNKPLDKVTKNCLICAKEFRTLQSYIRRGGGKYCSPECSYQRDRIFTEEHRRKIGVANSKRRLSLETRSKIAEKARGRTYSNDTREKQRAIMLSRALFGEKNPMWKGGVTALDKQIRNSDKYKAWRKEVYERDSYTCRICGDNRGGNLQADHIKPFSMILKENQVETLEMALNCTELWETSNGRTLCKSCHLVWGWNIFKTKSNPSLIKKGLI